MSILAGFKKLTDYLESRGSYRVNAQNTITKVSFFIGGQSSERFKVNAGIILKGKRVRLKFLTLESPLF